MEITEVRVKLMADPQDRLLAFCSLTLDGSFVVRDLKLIRGGSGPFVAMPSRKLTDRCPGCGGKNHLRAAYCSECGTALDADRAGGEEEGRTKLYADVAHPINSRCREQVERKVVEAYELERTLAAKPGYVCRYDDFDFDHPVARPTAEPPSAANAGAPAVARSGGKSHRVDGSQGRAHGPHRPKRVCTPHASVRPGATRSAVVRSSVRMSDEFGGGRG